MSDNLSPKRRIACYLLCFIAPALILTMAYAALGVHPFGEKSLLISDMDSQYSAFYHGLRHMFSGDATPLFSWQMAMGNNFFGLFTYYLSSPLSLITVFFPGGSLPDGIFLLTVIKVGLCGLTFSIFARRVFSAPAAALPGLSAAYALSSYAVIYAMMPMWLDAVMLLPLMALGIESLIRENRLGPLTLWTAAAILCNYYTAYMALLFASLWFLFRLATLNEGPGAVLKFFKKCGQYALCGALAACLGAMILLPAYMALTGGRVSGLSFDFDALSPALLGGKLINGVYDSFRYEATPYIYCGTAVVLLCVQFFTRRVGTRRGKWVAAAMTGVMALCFCLPALNGLFHMFQPPNWFMYRYAFIGPFFLVSLGCGGMRLREDGASRRRAALGSLVGFAGAAILYCAYALIAQEALPLDDGFSVTFALLAAAGVLLLIRELAGGPVLRRLMEGALALLLCADMFINAGSLITALNQDARYRGYGAWADFVGRTQPVVDEVEARDTGFYRMEKNFQRDFNDAISLGYNGIAHYSSAYKHTTNEFLSRMGFWQGWLWSSGRGATMASDALLGVKYRLTEGEALPGYDFLFEKNGIYAYINPCALPVAAVASSEMPDFQVDNPFELQNAYLQWLYPADRDYFVPVDYDIVDGNEPMTTVYAMEAVTDGPLYLFLDTSRNYSELEVFVNGMVMGNTFEESFTNKMIALGDFSLGESVEAELSSAEDPVLSHGYLMYQMDAGLLLEASLAIREKGLRDETVFANGISGELNVPEDGWLYTSIPYDDGWRLTVDGADVQTEKVDDSLLAARIGAGRHKIALRFMPPGFTAGAAISALALMLLIIGYGFRRTRKNKRLRSAILPSAMGEESGAEGEDRKPED